jgi:hypothetical protein
MVHSSDVAITTDKCTCQIGGAGERMVGCSAVIGVDGEPSNQTLYERYGSPTRDG